MIKNFSNSLKNAYSSNVLFNFLISALIIQSFGVIYVVWKKDLILETFRKYELSIHEIDLSKREELENLPLYDLERRLEYLKVSNNALLELIDKSNAQYENTINSVLSAEYAKQLLKINREMLIDIEISKLNAFFPILKLLLKSEKSETINEFMQVLVQYQLKNILKTTLKGLLNDAGYNKKIQRAYIQSSSVEGILSRLQEILHISKTFMFKQNLFIENRIINHEIDDIENAAYMKNLVSCKKTLSALIMTIMVSERALMQTSNENEFENFYSKGSKPLVSSRSIEIIFNAYLRNLNDDNLQIVKSIMSEETFLEKSQCFLC